MTRETTRMAASECPPSSKKSVVDAYLEVGKFQFGK